MVYPLKNLPISHNYKISRLQRVYILGYIMIYMIKPTLVRLEQKTKDKLLELKIHARQPYDEVIIMLIKEHKIKKKGRDGIS